MSHTRLAAGWCCLVLGVAVSAAAQDGRPLPASNELSTVPASEDGLRMPGFDATNDLTTRGRPPEPSAWDKMTTGTKNFFSKTYDVLTPWDTEAEKAKARRQPYRRVSKKQEKKPLFGNWWSAPEEPHQPKTVSQWLSQPRPQ